MNCFGAEVLDPEKLKCQYTQEWLVAKITRLFTA